MSFRPRNLGRFCSDMSHRVKLKGVKKNRGKSKKKKKR
jgi:hypothetical protein